MTKTQELLRARGIKALRVTIYFRLIFLIGYLALGPFVSKSQFETLLSTFLLCFAILIELLSLYLLSKKQLLFLIGSLNAVLDAVIVTALPVIWYLSVGGESIPPAYMIKGPLYYTYLFMFLCLNILSIEPFFVLFNAIGGILSQIGHFLYLVLEGRTTMTTDYVAHNVGVDVSPVFVFTVLFVYIMTGITLFYFLRNIKKTILTAVKNETANTQLGRYFSPNIRDKIMSEETNAIGEGQQQNVVVLFSDIRNFTSYCESSTPEDVIAFLRDYHSRMVNSIFKHSGTLDKFIGDGIMATFGTPTPSQDDAFNSIKAALEMSESLKDINKQRIADGLPKMNQGIGIHFGPAIVGNVGSEDRMEYTVIGDTVNVAARLESSTKELKEEIIISRELLDRISDRINFNKKGEIMLKGKKDPVEAIAVVGLI
ncbi:adenylate/guanylate cyclase domain-containing protein [bacterium]|nr:adenylate/guanylate cyclase domain-containing protein [bacterium]